MGNKVYYFDLLTNELLDIDDLGNKVIIDYKPASETAYLEYPTHLQTTIFGFTFDMNEFEIKKKIADSPVTFKLNNTSTDNPAWIYGMDSLQTTYMSPTPLDKSLDGKDVVWPSEPKIIPYSTYPKSITDKIEAIQPMLMEENEKGFIRTLYKCFDDAIVFRMLGDWPVIQDDYRATFVATVRGETEATLRDVKTLAQFKVMYSVEWFEKNITIFEQLFWGAWKMLNEAHEAMYFDGGMYSWDLLGIWQFHLTKKPWEIIAPVTEENTEYEKLGAFETEGGEAAILARFLDTTSHEDFKVLVIAPVNKMIDEPICSCVFGNDSADYKIPVRNEDGTINVTESYKTENINNFDHVTTWVSDDDNNYYKNSANIDRSPDELIHLACDLDRDSANVANHSITDSLEKLFSPMSAFINHDLTVTEIETLLNVIRKSSLVEADKHIDIWDMDGDELSSVMYLNDVTEIPDKPEFIESSPSQIETLMLSDNDTLRTSDTCPFFQIGVMKSVIDYGHRATVNQKTVDILFDKSDIHMNSGLAQFITMTSTSKIILPILKQSVRGDTSFWTTHMTQVPKPVFMTPMDRTYLQPAQIGAELINEIAEAISSMNDINSMLFKYYNIANGYFVREECTRDRSMLRDIVRSTALKFSVSFTDDDSYDDVINISTPWILPLILAQEASTSWGRYDNQWASSTRSITYGPPLWKPDGGSNSDENPNIAPVTVYGDTIIVPMRAYAQEFISEKYYKSVTETDDQELRDRTIFTKAYISAMSTMEQWSDVARVKTAGQLSDATKIGLLGIETTCVNGKVEMTTSDYALGTAKITKEAVCATPGLNTLLGVLCTTDAVNSMNEEIDNFYQNIINNGQTVTTCTDGTKFTTANSKK